MSIATLPQAPLEIQQYFSGLHIKLNPALPMSQEQFFDFCQQNKDLRFERTAEGELIIMPPSGSETGRRNLSVGAQLYNWSVADGGGEAYDSSSGFGLPSGATRAPDAAWVEKARLAQLTTEQREKFPPLCPDFITEVMSPTDSLPEAQRKMEEWIENGARLGWLIYPKKKQVYVYRPSQPVQALDNPQTISGDPELPGFVLDLEPVWRA